MLIKSQLQLSEGHLLLGKGLFDWEWDMYELCSFELESVIDSDSAGVSLLD